MATKDSSMSDTLSCSEQHLHSLRRDPRHSRIDRRCTHAPPYTPQTRPAPLMEQNGALQTVISFAFRPGLRDRSTLSNTLLRSASGSALQLQEIFDCHNLLRKPRSVYVVVLCKTCTCYDDDKFHVEPLARTTGHRRLRTQRVHRRRKIDSRDAGIACQNSPADR